MITYLQAVGVIEDFANQNEMVQKFGFEFKEQMPNIATEDERYPLLFVVPIGAMPTTNTNEFEIDIYCLDRYTQDRVNVGSVVSDTQLILAMLTKWLEEGQTDMDVIHSYPMQPINNDLLDYCGGWSMRVRVEVDMVSICEIPLSGSTPTPPTPCEDSTYTITDSALTTLYSGSIVSGGDLDQPISDSVAVLKDTAGTVISTTNILAEGSEDILAPDASYLVEYVNGTDIQSGSIVSGGSVVVTVPNPISCADTTLEVNGTTEGIFASGSTIDVQLNVTPDSVTVVGNTVNIDVPLDLYWELNFNTTDDVIFIQATSTNVGTLTSGSGSNVGTITVSTDGVTYGALSFPFTPVATTTYYFKRSTATVTGAYTMVGTYV